MNRYGLTLNPSPVYTRVEASFKPNKKPLKLMKQFVTDAQLIN